jgi:molecular chaperone DnaJ
MNTENLYETLGVNENATQDEIKKSYRRLVKEKHPDAGGNEEEFKKISVAYDTLGDEGKRKQYDSQKNNPFSNMGGMGDFFSQMYNNNRTTQQRVPTTTISINVGVLESYKGDKKNIVYQRKKKCEPCGGSGGDKKTCSNCNGQGSFTRQVGSGFFVQIVQMECQQCRGTGQMIIDPCFICNGVGTQPEMKNVEVKLPHGIDNGHHVRLQGMGDFHSTTYGDLIVRINLVPQENFERVGSHLVYNAFVDLEELKSGTISVPHPDGKLNLKLPKKVDTSIPLRVKSKGFRIDSIGDLIVNQYVRFTRD